MVLLFDFPGIGTNDNLKRMMDHSNDPKRAASALAHYVDDSGTHGTSKFALMGGPVFVRDRIFLFHNSWEKTLALHKVSGPIHMIEFGQKDRLGYLTHDERRALFQDLGGIAPSACTADGSEAVGVESMYFPAVSDFMISNR